MFLVKRGKYSYIYSMEHACEPYVGTSGWSYQHWKEVFYPEGVKPSEWFEYYAKHFSTVEINNTFYQLPKADTFKKWYAAAPGGFVYSVKANRYITHVKRLNDVDDAVRRFFENAKLLKDKLGVVLYQLPPGMKKDVNRLGSFIKLIKKRRVKAVFEFRNESWYDDEVFRLLDNEGCGFCVHDLEGKETPKIITGKVVYIRFHGAGEKYGRCYQKRTLSGWAKWIDENRKNVNEIWAYFNNDADGNAIFNARTLKEFLRQ